MQCKNKTKKQHQKIRKKIEFFFEKIWSVQKKGCIFATDLELKHTNDFLSQINTICHKNVWHDICNVNSDNIILIN